MQSDRLCWWIFIGLYSLPRVFVEPDQEQTNQESLQKSQNLNKKIVKFHIHRRIARHDGVLYCWWRISEKKSKSIDLIQG